MSRKPKNSPVKAWWDRVQKAREERKKHSNEWDLLVDDYKPVVRRLGVPEDVKTNIHFRNVEQKKPQLFFQRPDLKLKAKSQISSPVMDPNTGQPITDEAGQPVSAEDALVIHEEVLNYHMGPEGVKLSLLMDRLLFDCLCPSGMMVSKIGYRPYIEEIDQPVMQPSVDPFSGQEVIGPDGQPQQEQAVDEKGKPVTQKVPVMVKEEYFWRRVSPKNVLIPKEFKDTDFELAPWLGVEFSMAFREAKRQLKLPSDFEPKRGDIPELLGKSNKQDDSHEQTIRGIEIFYKAHLYRDDVVHPDVYWQLVLIEGHRDSTGVPVAAVDRICPYQDLDPNTLKLTPDSMIGNPIHVGTIRDLSDSAYVPSDSAMTHTLVKEIDTYRNQTVKLREANISKYGYDADKLLPETLASIQAGDVGQFIPFQGGALAAGMDKIMAPITKNTNTRADVEGAFQLEQDMEKTLAIGANQAGGTTATGRTATELSIIQNNTDARMGKEQQRVVSYVIAGIRKYDSLLQRFADDEDLIEIVGQDGVRRLQSWNRHLIAGRFSYEIYPDSQLRLDAATERAQTLEYYNLTAQDPFNNRKESLRKVQRMFNIDPSKGTQEPPPPGPPPPNVSFRFAGDDLFNPMVREIIAQAGYNISPESVQEAMNIQGALQTLDQTQPGHPGTAERIPPVSKRAEGLTGSLPGPTTQGQQ